MTDLRARLDALMFSARGAITPQLIADAQKMVAEDATPGAVEAFRDQMTVFRDKGYLDAKTRTALDRAYAELVAALPEPAVGPVTEPALAERLGEIQGVIGARKAEIAALETKLSATEAKIAQKASRASTLLSEKQQYQKTLQEKERNRETLLILALFGGFGAAGTAVGLGAAMSLGDLRSTIQKLDQEIAATQAERATLDGALARHKSEQRSRRRELDALQATEKTLAQVADDDLGLDALSPEARIAALRGRIGETQALADNLRQQIALLTTMNGAASTLDDRLAGVVTALEADLKVLEDRVKASEKALLGTVIDLVFAAAKVPASIPVGPLSISKKTLLLDGLAGVKMSIDRQIEGLASKMVAEGLVSAGVAKPLAQQLAKLLLGENAAKNRPSEVVASLSPAAFAALTAPQRLAMDALLENEAPSPTREARLGALASGALSDAQARAYAAIALMPEGTGATKQQTALDAIVAAPSLMRAQAGRAVLEYGLGTSYGDEPLATTLDRLAPLCRRAISFYPSDAPAARALALALDTYDQDAREPVEDHAMFRAAMRAAVRLSTRPQASDAEIAREVLAAWKGSTSERWGEGMEDRQRLDAQRALAHLARVLGANDPALPAAPAADLAGLSAQLDALAAALAARP